MYFRKILYHYRISIGITTYTFVCLITITTYNELQEISFLYTSSSKHVDDDDKSESCLFPYYLLSSSTYIMEIDHDEEVSYFDEIDELLYGESKIYDLNAFDEE